MALGGRVPVEALGVGSALLAAGQLPEACVQQPGAESLGVTGLEDQRAVESCARLRQSAHVGDDAWRSAGRRLEHDQAEALEREAGDDSHVGGAVGVDQLGVRDPAQDSHPPRERRLGALANYLLMG